MNLGGNKKREKSEEQHESAEERGIYTSRGYLIEFLNQRNRSRRKEKKEHTTLRASAPVSSCDYALASVSNGPALRSRSTADGRGAGLNHI